MLLLFVGVCAKISKYFNNEALEVARYDKSLAGHQAASLKTTSSLSILNFGQSFIFSASLTGLMIMAANGVAAGNKNHTMITLY